MSSFEAPVFELELKPAPESFYLVEAPLESESIDEEPFKLPAVLTEEQEELLHQFYPMAEAYARKAFSRNRAGTPYADFEEMLGDAFFGLAKAVVRFDPVRINEMATTHSDYFTKCIKGEISRGMRDRYGRSYDGVDPHTGEPTKAGTARIKPSVLFNDSKALDKPVESEDSKGDTIGSLMPASLTDEDSYEYALLKADVERIVSRFDERDQQIFNLYVFEDFSQQEIAEVVGVSQMHVSRILARLKDRVRIQLAA